MQMTPELFEMIARHEADGDFVAARLRCHGSEQEMFAILQAECRSKCRAKLASTLASGRRFIFPDRIAAEQASDDRIAAFHATLAGDNPEQTMLLDATAGLGIDAMAMARRGAAVVAFDLREAAALALAHNAAEAGLRMDVRCGDSIEFLRSNPEARFDVIFIDPARRDDAGRRVYSLADCVPDVTEHLPLLMSHTRRLIIKASPMLDVTETLRRLPGATEIYAAGTATECKELLIVVDREASEPTPVRRAAVTVSGTDEPPVIFRFSEAGASGASDCADTLAAGMLLHEPYPAVMKMGGGSDVARACGVRSVAANTHLFVSDAPAENFPGRTYVIDAVLPAGGRKGSRELKKHLAPGERLNVTCRNFPLSAQQLVATLGIREGGTRRLFAVTDSRGTRHLLLVCPV